MKSTFWRLSILVELASFVLLPNRAFAQSWCPASQHVLVKNWNMYVLGTDAKNRCRLSAETGPVSVEYAVDRDALEKLKDPKTAKTGSGCLKFTMKKLKRTTEVCFGK